MADAQRARIGSWAFDLTVYGFGQPTSYWYGGGLELERFRQ